MGFWHRRGAVPTTRLATKRYGYQKINKSIDMMVIWSLNRPDMLSQTVGYAIAALGHLSRFQKQPGPQFVRDIAKATGIPPAYLAKIVHTLARKGYLTTQRGRAVASLWRVLPRT